MISKKIANPKKSGSKSARASGLVNYITEPEKESGLEKCIHSEAENFITVDREAQIAEMTALASESVRSADPIDHWVISWKKNEQPTIEQAREAVGIFIKYCGLEGHQFVWGLHDDTQNMHVHIAVNRVHPDTLKVVKINKGFDREASQQVVALIEHAQGWTPEKGSRYEIQNGKPVKREQAAEKPLEPTTKARDMEQQTGEKSAQRIGIEDAAPLINEARTWRELHDKLAASGMSYERKGSGAVICVGDVVVKASDVDRKASLGALQKRLGAYQPPQEIKPDEYFHHNSRSDTRTLVLSPKEQNLAALGNEPRNGLRNLSECRVATYKEGIKTNSTGVLHIASRANRRTDDGLRRVVGRSSKRDSGQGLKHVSRPLKAHQPGWNEYQVLKAERNTGKETETLAMRLRQETARKALYEKQKTDRKQIFAERWAGRGDERNAMQSVIATQHAAEKLAMQEQQRAERKELQAKYASLPQYKQWKEQPQILAAKERQRTPEQDRQLSHILRDLTHRTDRLGTTYKSNGVAVFRDEGKILKVLNEDPHNLAATIAVAQQKFGQTLTITGSDEFKQKCVAAVVEHSMTVKFSDPHLEAKRVKAFDNKRLAERAAQQAKAKQVTTQESKMATENDQRLVARAAAEREANPDSRPTKAQLNAVDQIMIEQAAQRMGIDAPKQPLAVYLGGTVYIGHDGEEYSLNERVSRPVEDGQYVNGRIRGFVDLAEGKFALVDIGRRNIQLVKDLDAEIGEQVVGRYRAGGFEHDTKHQQGKNKGKGGRAD